METNLLITLVHKFANNKLKALESIDRPVTNTKVERKGNSLIDLLEKMKSLDSPLEKERDFEPHHRSASVKTMIDNWHNRQKSSLINIDIPINMIYTKDDKRNDLRTLKTTLTKKKEYNFMHIAHEKGDMIDIERGKGIIKRKTR